MDIKTLAVELQSLGVKVPETYTGRKGGAGPAEGQTIILDGCYLNVPTQSWFVSQSPYSVEMSDGSFVLKKNVDNVLDVSFPDRPKYYDLETKSGVSSEKIALLHGSNCLASTVYQSCAYWNTDMQCKFCGIGLSLDSGETVIEKSPEDLAFAAERAGELDGAKHVTLTTGMRLDNASGIEHLLQCVEKIKNRADIPVHVQICPPEKQDVFDKLKRAGADTIGIHIETCNMDILEHFAPGKARTGLQTYINCWEYAVAVFGRNQVSSFVIAGLGQKLDSVLADAEFLCGIGVFPYVLPLRPVPGTAIEKLRPPLPEDMIIIYEQLSCILKKHGMSSKKSKAGCVRCGACSCLSLFEKE